MRSFYVLLPFFKLCISCPIDSYIYVDSFFALSTNVFQSSETGSSKQVCNITFVPQNSKGFVVSVSNFFLFSHRQPKNTKEIVIYDNERAYILENEVKAYRSFVGSITIEMPMNLNFRSILILTPTKDCSSDTFQCELACEDCDDVCLSNDLICDNKDNCGEEKGCADDQKKSKRVLSSVIYDQSSPSSSQLMLIGFFVLNGSFIIFFLVLSLCSAGFCYSWKMYYKSNRRSRITFLKFIRDADKSPPARPETQAVATSPVSPFLGATNNFSSSPIGDRRHRPSILSRINFEPAPPLTELEPELEDRTTTPKQELCAPPEHRSELFLRRQSLPVIQKVTAPRDPNWKRSSVGGRPQ